jgi:hypothetical protein
MKHGRLTCAAGPMLVSEADVDILSYLDYSGHDLAWIEEHRDEFRVMTRVDC